MALTKEKKAETVARLSDLLSHSKLTVMAKYSGTSVKSLQSLRKGAKDSGTIILVTKNRLFKQALGGVEKYKDADSTWIEGQLLYAFNPSDEVAPAQELANFAKTEPQLEFVGGLSDEGIVLASEDVKVLASLPSKDQLRAQLVATVSAPLTGFIQVASGNVRGILNVLSARAEQL